MTAVDAQRWIPEPTKDSGYGRTPYQRDRARVLHSAGFRRLAAKTQVHTAGADDFLRTRLTHSLEVAQISREMGTRLEAKVPGAGLNLTRATLDACAKYPWFRRPGTRKFGVYADDEPVFTWL